MATEWQWLASFSASCLHAAHSILGGKKLVNSQHADKLALPAAELGEQINSSGLPEARFWRFLHALGHQIENNRELALTAMRKTVGASGAKESIAAQIAARIGDLELA